MLHEAFEANLRAFREKFGRDPRPDDPVLFDPDADEPMPLSPEGWQAGFEELRQAAQAASVDPAYVAARQEIGYIVTDGNRHLLTAAEVQAYLDAVDRHQQPPLPADLFAVELTVAHCPPGYNSWPELDRLRLLASPTEKHHDHHGGQQPSSMRVPERTRPAMA